MIDFQLLSSIITVLALGSFVAIVAWAVSPRQKQSFDTAANLPFALQDDALPAAAPAAPSSVQPLPADSADGATDPSFSRARS